MKYMRKCLQCDQEIPKTRNKSKNIFCDIKCKEDYRKIHKKMPKLRQNCLHCKEETEVRRKYCNKCVSNRVHQYKMSESDYENQPISEIYIEEHRTAKYQAIRNHAKFKMKNKPQVCSECGYSKHVECCHLRAISDFPPETLLNIVNSYDNLVLLCPNCHWELDHGL